jgi:putative ABC transport system permease protein
MLFHYFKQAWNLLRSERLFSSIYIIGTGLSISVVMALGIVYYVKVADIYPETNRGRTLSALYGVETRKGGRGYSSSMLSKKFIDQCLKPLKSAEAVATVVLYSGNEYYVQPGENSNEQWPVTTQFVDTSFWKVFAFRFLDGKPFSRADFLSGLPKAVISRSLAERLFGSSAAAVGKYVSLNFRPYQVTGVVRDVSKVTNTTYADLWLPLSLLPPDPENRRAGMLGRFGAYILAKPGVKLAKVKAEALGNLARYAQPYADKYSLSLSGQPDTQWQSIFRMGSGDTINFNQILLRYGLIVLALLLVPAISLSGMTDSRVERRLAELGVRRAFGARRGALLFQVLGENLLYTLLGGLLGLLLSYGMVCLASDWVMSLVGGGGASPFVWQTGSTTFRPAMLLNLPVFGLALAACLVLNLLSALIPAWKASRREIIYSLNF